MKVTAMTTQMTVIHQFTITEGLPVIPMAYSSPRKDVRIDSGLIQYTWEDGGWKVRDAWAISLTGTVLKKDGTDSKNAHSRHPEDAYDWRLGLAGREWVAPEGWEWLDGIIDLLRPTSVVSVELFSEYEVQA